MVWAERYIQAVVQPNSDRAKRSGKSRKLENIKRNCFLSVTPNTGNVYSRWWSNSRTNLDAISASGPHILTGTRMPGYRFRDAILPTRRGRSSRELIIYRDDRSPATAVKAPSLSYMFPIRAQPRLQQRSRFTGAESSPENVCWLNNIPGTI